MAIIIWNLEEMVVSSKQVQWLLDNGYIYDPNTGDEYDMDDLYYPDDFNEEIEANRGNELNFIEKN